MFLQNIIRAASWQRAGASSIKLVGIASEDYTQMALRRNGSVYYDKVSERGDGCDRILNSTWLATSLAIARRS